MELDVCSQCDVIFYPDPDEVALVEEALGPGRNYYPNPVFIYDQFQIEQGRARLAKIKGKQGNRLLFVGGFNHLPNEEGVVWFIEEVLPLVREKLPSAKVDVAGSNPPPSVTGLAGEGIEVLGLVSDEHLERLYSQAALAIAPLRSGAGVKGKIIEALAFGIPVATTPIGAQGIKPAAEILFVGETPEELAQAIIDGLNDREEALRRASNGLDFVARHYGREQLMEVFRKLILAPASA
jgi:glycosyltransferase involved in cell wall biosynthesis